MSVRLMVCTDMAPDQTYAIFETASEQCLVMASPRRYNLFDHMKRVHQYDGPTTEPSLTTMQAPAPRKPMSRKRKASTDDVVSEKRQRVVKLSAEQQRQQRRNNLTQEFLSKKQHIIDILANLSSPSDLGDDIQLTKEVVGLHEICIKFREISGD